MVGGVIDMSGNYSNREVITKVIILTTIIVITIIIIIIIIIHNEGNVISVTLLIITIKNFA